MQSTICFSVCSVEGEFQLISLFSFLQLVLVLMLWSEWLLTGKMLSGEEDGLEDDAERAEVTTGSFTGEMHLPRNKQTTAVLEVYLLTILPFSLSGWCRRIFGSPGGYYHRAATLLPAYPAAW